MSIYYQDDQTTVYHGDCIEVMRNLPESSVDSIVTDPPYGLGFMGAKWDALPPGKDWAEECLRVLKPGGHLLAFGGTRTWHRLAVAIEDAGFEIRDSIMWLYGSGFPKSHDVGKAIDKARDEDAEPRRAVARALREALDSSGKTRREIDQHFGTANVSQYWFSPDRNTQTPPADKWPWLRDFLNIGPGLDAEVWRLNGRKGQPGENWDKREVVGRGQSGPASVAFTRDSAGTYDITTPATPEAAQWEGWGTALKPANEPIVMARKPFKGTVAANVLEHGTGALNIDACRVSPLTDAEVARSGKSTNGGIYGEFQSVDWKSEGKAHPGRWPANVILDEHTAAWVDEQSGVTTSPPVGSRTMAKPRKSGSMAGALNNPAEGMANGHGDSGGASRFFYVAKAPKRERPEVNGVKHATVKPLTLMRYLVRMVTPPNGIVLDPFAGSGTTIEAALLEGFQSIGIELTDEYLPLIQQRIQRQEVIE